MLENKRNKFSYIKNAKIFKLFIIFSKAYAFIFHTLIKINMKEGIYMLKIDNLNFSQYPYEYPFKCPDIDSLCRDLENEILGGNTEYICDMISELSDGAVDIYTSDLYKTAMTPEFAEYIEDSIREFGVPTKSENFLTKLLQMAEYSYYFEQLQNNLENIIKNAIINYINKNTISYSNPEDEERIIDFINDYIDEVQVDSDVCCSDIIENFAQELSKEFGATIQPRETKIKCLYVKPNEYPIKIEIENDDKLLENLNSLVGGYIQCLPLYNKDGLTDLVCNESSKIINNINNRPNRAITYHQLFGNNNQEIADIIYGPFLIVNSNGENFTSLEEKDFKKWENEFSKTESPFLGSFLLDNEFLDFPTSPKADGSGSRTHRGDER